MPKKYKRQTRKVVPASPTAEATPVTTSGGSQGADKKFNPDYSYVIKDLKRIGILAGVFFGILVILSFFL